jgi:hypothetical protein
MDNRDGSINTVWLAVTIQTYSYLYKRHAKSQWSPSSLDISSFEKVKPGIRPLFFSQKMAQKLPEKKIPSTHAKATSLTANDIGL